MKKTLVITLALVMAFASSAMAAVNFSGEFKTTIKSETFDKDFLKDFKIDSTASLNASASNSADDSWSLEVDLKLLADEKLGGYKLSLTDQYFNAWVWGNGKEVSDKGTPLGLLSVGKKTEDGEDRARLEVGKIADLATITLDLNSGESLYGFVDLDIAGYEAGIAAAQTNAFANTTVVGWGKAGLDLADTTVNLEGAVGMTFVDEPEEEGEVKENGLGFGAKVSADVIDGLNVWGKFVSLGNGWAGGGGTASEKVVSGGATYEESALKVTGEVSHVIDGANTVSANAQYRFSETVGWDDLFKGDKYFNNDAPAAGLFANLDDFKIKDITLKVASPVLEDFIWAKAEAKYYPTTKKDENDEDVDAAGIEASVNAHIKATDKLTVEPFASYKNISNTITVGTDAGYKIGTSDNTVDLKVKKVFDDTDPESLVQASFTVKY